jgi:probable addiction module antidote protein
MMSKTKKFDAVEYLGNPTRRAAYLAAALETGDPDFVRDALGIIAKAIGMNKVAASAGLNRVSLYKALGRTGNPEFVTVMNIVNAMRLTMSARPATKKKGGSHRVSAKTVRRAITRLSRATRAARAAS